MLKDLVRSKGMSQRQLAHACNVSSTAVDRWCTTRPPVARLPAIADALNLTDAEVDALRQHYDVPDTKPEAAPLPAPHWFDVLAAEKGEDWEALARQALPHVTAKRLQSFIDRTHRLATNSAEPHIEPPDDAPNQPAEQQPIRSFPKGDIAPAKTS